MIGRSSLFLLSSLAGCGRLVVHDADAGATSDATAAVDAPAPAIDAVSAPDARPVDPACDFVLELRRDAVEMPLEIAFAHGIVRAQSLEDGSALELYLAPDGAGVAGGQSAEYVDPLDSLRIEWNVPVVRVAYSVTGGIDGNDSGDLSHSYEADSVVSGHQPAVGDSSDQPVVSDRPITYLSLYGSAPDSIRVGSVAYSICTD